jgi:hypothetical protein
MGDEEPIAPGKDVADFQPLVGRENAFQGLRSTPGWDVGRAVGHANYTLNAAVSIKRFSLPPR